MMARVVHAQLASATTAFFRRDVWLADKVMEKDDQVDNLLGGIEEKCFRRLSGLDAEDPRSRRLRGVFRVALNLEKLGDYAVNIAEQACYAAQHARRPIPFDLAGPVRVALGALDEVITAFTDASADKAKHACACEVELDRQYRDALADTFRRLALPGQDPAFVITHLFVAKFLERIGDSILNIGETTLYILTGERLKLHQYLHLEEMVAHVTGGRRVEDVDFSQIWGGISGSRVGRLSLASGPLIWKEGAPRKIDEEIREMEEWNRLVPGLVPDVKDRYRAEGRESFLGVFLEGTLLRDIYLTRASDEKLRITARLLETVRDIWVETSEKIAPRVDYVRQIVDRLPELYGIHPRLERLRAHEIRIFGISHRPLETLLRRLAAVEATLAPPNTVRLHGDFNTNNIVYDPRTQRIHYIDVHRSGPGDYLQDISVFMVSNLRQPIRDGHLARDFDEVNAAVKAFAADFARLIDDVHFEARLLLAKARSLITSGRVVTDGEFAQRIFLEGVRLLERADAAAVAA
jgi:phosphate uptake regulator/thiamine kinase-like enzyme